MKDYTFTEFVIFIVACVVVHFVNKWLRERGEESVSESLGAVKGLDVDIVDDEGRYRVGLTFPGDEGGTVRVILSPQQARLLAEWLRIAATKGRTLTIAKFNYRRAKAAPVKP